MRKLKQKQSSIQTYRFWIFIIGFIIFLFILSFVNPAKANQYTTIPKPVTLCKQGYLVYKIQGYTPTNIVYTLYKYTSIKCKSA